MKNVINHLESLRKLELKQVGLTPLESFKGTQKEHDNYHKSEAIEYGKAIKILKSKIQIRDFTTSEVHEFRTIHEAELRTKELNKFEEIDYQMYIVIKDKKNIIK